MAGLRIADLRKAYGRSRSSRGIDLDIADGEIRLLPCPSGCGKSTLLRSIAGLEALSSGEIHLGQRDITDAPSARRDIAMVFQNYALYPHMTVTKNMSFGLSLERLKRDEIDRRVQEAAEILRIAICCIASRSSCRAASASGWRSGGPSCASRNCSAG